MNLCGFQPLFEVTCCNCCRKLTHGDGDCGSFTNSVTLSLHLSTMVPTWGPQTLMVSNRYPLQRSLTVQQALAGSSQSSRDAVDTIDQQMGTEGLRGKFLTWGGEVCCPRGWRLQGNVSEKGCRTAGWMQT